MRRCHPSISLIGLAVALCGVANAAPVPSGSDIVANGVAAKGVPACVACHGAKGEGQPAANIPRLAGLDAGYTERQLTLFASGARNNPIMGPFAQGLSPADRKAVAAYYGAMRTPAASAAPAQPAGHGAALAQTGRWSANIPPCASCHGDDGLGVGSTVPPLSGQPAGYIEAALNGWRDGSRTGDPLGLMTGVAKALSPNEISDVAAYYAARAAAPTTSSAAKGRKPR